jgi:hypothetical protein
MQKTVSRRQGKSGKKIDIGYVGEVIEVNVAPLKESIVVRLHARHQPDRARRGRENLQLQRRRRRRACAPSRSTPSGSFS